MDRFIEFGVISALIAALALLFAAIINGRVATRIKEWELESKRKEWIRERRLRDAEALLGKIEEYYTWSAHTLLKHISGFRRVLRDLDLSRLSNPDADGDALRTYYRARQEEAFNAMSAIIQEQVLMLEALPGWVLHVSRGHTLWFDNANEIRTCIDSIGSELHELSDHVIRALVREMHEVVGLVGDLPIQKPSFLQFEARLARIVQEAERDAENISWRPPGSRSEAILDVRTQVDELQRLIRRELEK